MMEIHGASGTAYCIDRLEVSEAHYAEFLAKASAKPGSEHEYCGANATYEPGNHRPDPIEPKTCTNVWSPETTPDRPVVCVDWCDAVAYCAWAGKRLCGKIGGGPLVVTGDISNPNDPAHDAAQSQWYAACSQGGKNKYPYGDTYDPNACAGNDVSEVDAGVWKPRADTGSFLGCRGPDAPYSSVLDLSGSVAEFTDECITSEKGLTTCAVRGGDFRSEADELRCDRLAGTGVYNHEPIYGFRCCKDLP